ncbi:MAG: succinyl-diaminopimelate desuccinylase [Proteobacteria bacterium]|nr:succinyl-diaminopimelate desuccinylase [Pseudomonadota bacterium]
MSTGTAQPEIELLCDLISRPSITPDDAGCQQLLIERLSALGFECETLIFGTVTNLWARRGKASPVLCFAGHTDVVPPGDEAKWSSAPFTPTLNDGYLYGRGSADMKSGLAAMVVAIEQFLAANPDPAGSLAMLITSDEEGRAREGTLKVVETLAARDEHIDWCVLGEPSSQETLGDVVRIGRRGSLSGILTVNGIQGHVAYPQTTDNPIRRFAPILAQLHEIEWDEGNEHFPPTSFQVVDVHSGAGATNVTPAQLTARFNLRYSTEWSYDTLQERVQQIFDEHDIDYELQWHLSGEPFLTQPGRLIDAVSQAVTELSGSAPELSTGGGTSDGRFISPAGAEVVELGPVNASIHKIDERVRVDDVIKLTAMYRRIMELLLGGQLQLGGQ